MKKFAVISMILALGLVAGLAFAQRTVTNDLGRTSTVTLMEDVSATGTVTKDISVYPSGSDRRGLHVIHCDLSAGQAVGATDYGYTLPKGAILLEDAVVEVQTAVAPAGSTNTLAIGGITVIATGTTLNSTGIKAAVATAGITTADDKLAVTVAGNAATAGEFTVYLPYILGNDSQ